MRFPKLPFSLHRSHLIGLFILATIIIILQIIFFQSHHRDNIIQISNKKYTQDDSKRKTLTHFDPNTFSSKEWQQIGFSEKQTQTILAYKSILGGKFASKEELKKCYAISEKKFNELEKYILLPEKIDNTVFSKNNTSHLKNTKNTTIKISQKFNPDNYTIKDWEKLGVSQKQASVIVKYKNSLGGSFGSKEKFKQCFVISEDKFKTLEPYLIFNEVSPQKYATKNSVKYDFFDPNNLTADEWQKLGFSEKQTQVIMNYKNTNLKGYFKNLDDIKSCFVISPKKFEELKPYIKLSFPNTTKEEKQIDFSSLDVNEVTFRQLIDFGIDEKAVKSFLRFRKVLGGFTDKNQIFETFHMNKESAEKLIKTLNLNTSQIKKYHLKDAPESFLRTHPYFKHSADKIIFYRLSSDTNDEILQKLMLKPEQELKMKWYLKD